MSFYKNYLFTAKNLRWWHWLGIVCLLVIIALGVRSVRQAPTNPTIIPKNTGTTTVAGRRGARVPSVVVAVARTADVPIELTALGTVSASQVVSVRARVDGQLQQVLFREGQLVKKDEVLAEMDSKPFAAQLLQAQGQLQRDQALLDNARLDLQRYQKLLGQDSIAAQQVDTQQALVRQYEGTVKVDQAQVDNARLQWGYTRIVAPISGRLGLRQVDAGNLIHANDANGLVIITQLQPVTVLFAIPEINLTRIQQALKTQQKLKVTVWDRDQKNKLASGVLLTLDNQIDVATGTIKLKAEFLNHDFVLFPNQFVNVRLQLDVQQNALVIPSAAVLRGAPGMLVYVVKPDQSVTVRPVQLGANYGELVVINHGIAAGEKVVIDGTDALREGLKIEIAGAPAKNGR